MVRKMAYLLFKQGTLPLFFFPLPFFLSSSSPDIFVPGEVYLLLLWFSNATWGSLYHIVISLNVFVLLVILPFSFFLLLPIFCISFFFHKIPLYIVAWYDHMIYLILLSCIAQILLFTWWFFPFSSPVTFIVCLLFFLVCAERRHCKCWL